MKIEFQFMAGARSGERIESDARGPIRIGRHPDNDVVFDVHRDLSVSGHHAEVRAEEDGYYLYDVGSSNGTYVGNQRVERVRLRNGLEVTFGSGGPVARIRLVDDADTLPTADSVVPVGESRSDPSGSPPVGPAGSSPAGPGSGAGAPAGASEGSGAAPSAGSVAAAALGPERKVGARTVAMMIDAALQQSKQQQRGGVGKSTVFVRSMVNQAVTRSTRRFKVVVVLLSVLLVAAVGGFLVLRYVERRQSVHGEAELRAEMARLMERQQGASSEEKLRLAKKLDQLNRKLGRSKAPGGGKAIVKRNLRAVFLLACEVPDRGPKGFCTGFSVTKRVLGTNAHCIVALERYRDMGMKVFAVMNRNPSERFNIIRVARDPRYHKPTKSISRDVGLVQVDHDLPVQVELATNDALAQLESGDVMFMYGFPGRLANVASPSATLVQGVIGRVTRLDGSFGKFEDNVLIQHSAFTSGGTSGSPVFNTQGQVIAVNTGGYVEPGSMQVMDPSTGRAGKLVVAKQLAGYNFGIRIDLLEALMEDIGQ